MALTEARTAATRTKRGTSDEGGGTDQGGPRTSKRRLGGRARALSSGPRARTNLARPMDGRSEAHKYACGGRRPTPMTLPIAQDQVHASRDINASQPTASPVENRMASDLGYADVQGYGELDDAL